MSETASRSGYDSASEMAQGRTKEAAGKLAHDEKLEQEGISQQADADAEEREILKTWRREHDLS
ncbi:MAG: hypothetical protein ACRDZ3_03335 [Acidimicrobiia bacterium]